MCAERRAGPPRRAQRGVSIIEVMVGMVVALLVGLAAAGSAILFTASQRQGIGTGGALVNAGTVLTAIRDDVAAAGLGFFGDKQYLCTALNVSVDNAVITNGAAFTPLNITTEAAGDRIDVVWATLVAGGANVLLAGATTGANAQLRSLLPVSVGQAVLLAPSSPGDPCLVRTVSAVAAATETTPQTLTFSNAGANSTYNKGVFTTNPTYPDKGRIAQLGDLRWSRYRLNGTNLQYERPLGGDAVVLVRNVVGFRAQYGIADTTTSATSLAAWQSATGGYATLTPALLPRVRALRVGIVTRSPQAEKPDATTGQCTATTTLPALFGTTVTADVTNWQCFRYRTAIVVVPLRNLVNGL